MEHVPVSIVGGGPVGLAAALELARHGVRALLVERHAVIPDGTEPPPVADVVIDYIPCGRPGHRAPHVWLERDGRRRSTLDFFGPGFTVLAASRGDAWIAAAKETGQRLGVRVDAHAIGARGGWMDSNNAFGQHYGIDATGAVLVRPDGHVAFRKPHATADPTDELTGALAQILARSARPSP